mgnify:CR=1 FL=1
MVVYLNEDQFQKEVLESEKPVLVDFYADWCGPCKMMSPILDKLAVEWQDKLKVAKINVDDAPDLAQQYGIMSIPTLLFFKNGEVVDKRVGVVSKEEIVSIIKSIA